jgi:hypothetical protein
MALGKTVRQLLAEIDSAELSEWLAFDAEYTIPDAHFSAATISLAVTRSMTGSRVEAGDFAPIYKAPPRIQTAAEAIAALRSFSALHNRKSKNG